MHWFWRAAIAVFVASVYGGLSVTVFESGHAWAADTIAGMLGGPTLGGWNLGVAVSISFFAPVTVLGMVTLGLVTRYFGPAHPVDRETRCRKCDYILRGITEPRCPECGERI